MRRLINESRHPITGEVLDRVWEEHGYRWTEHVGHDPVPTAALANPNTISGVIANRNRIYGALCAGVGITIGFVAGHLL